MQNKAKLQKAEIALIPYMSNRYANICSLRQTKNKAKTKPNKAKSKPILTQLNTKQSQTNPNQTQFIVSLSNLFIVSLSNLFSVNLDNYSLRTFSELACSEQGRTIEAISALPFNIFFYKPSNPKVRLLDNAPDKIPASREDFVPIKSGFIFEVRNVIKYVFYGSNYNDFRNEVISGCRKRLDCVK